MTPPQKPFTFTDFVTKREMLQIVKGLVQFYDLKIAEVKNLVSEKLETHVTGINSEVQI